jgi:hypothetical protein
MARHIMMPMSYPSEKSANNSFQFISIQNPNDAKDRTARRLARSHAVARGLEKKRQLEQKSGDNFRPSSLRDDAGRPTSRRKGSQALIAKSASLSVGASATGPFQMLAAESPRLQALLSHRMILASAENYPVFSVSDELVLRNFRSVLRTGLDDHALLSAVMLTFAFAAAPGSIDRECLRYQGEALSSIREKMSSPDRASESTLGAILLLAGIEVCLLFEVRKQACSYNKLTFSWYRLGLECPVKSNFTWEQYMSFLTSAEPRGFT